MTSRNHNPVYGDEASTVTFSRDQASHEVALAARLQEWLLKKGIWIHALVATIDEHVEFESAEDAIRGLEPQEQRCTEIETKNLSRTQDDLLNTNLEALEQTKRSFDTTERVSGD